MPNYDLKDMFFEKCNSWNHRAYDAGFLWHVHSLIDIGGMAANIVTDDKNIAPLYRVGCTVFPRKIVSIAFEGVQRHKRGSFVQQSLSYTHISPLYSKWDTQYDGRAFGGSSP